MFLTKRMHAADLLALNVFLVEKVKLFLVIRACTG
jgi:hypothetical protein